MTTEMRGHGMDESQIEDTLNLARRAKHDTTANFVTDMAMWGFNYHDHMLLWEAMVSVIEAEGRGDLEFYPAKGPCVDGCSRCDGGGWEDDGVYDMSDDQKADYFKRGEDE